MPHLGRDFFDRLSLVVAILLILATAWIAFQGFRDFVAANNRVDELAERLRLLQSLQSTLTDIEIGQRGYLLSGKESFLQLYESATRKLPTVLSELSDATTIASEAESLSQLRELSLKGSEMSAQLIEQRSHATEIPTDHLEQAGAVMDQIRRLVDGLVVQDQAQMRVIHSDVDEEARQAELLLMVGPSASVLIVIAVFWRVAREIAGRRGAETALRVANEALEVRVAQRTAAIAQEARLRAETADTLSAVVASASFAIVGFDRHRKVSLWNPAAKSILGYTVESIVGRDYPVAGTRQLAEFNAILDRCESGEQPRGVSVRHQRHDGTEVDLSLSAAALRDECQGLRGFALLMEDVTERLANERQLRRTQRLEAMGQLTGGVAHDFNNMLNAVVMNLDLALGPEGKEGNARGFVEMALGSALRGANLTQRLLAFARQQPLVPEVVDLHLSIADFLPLIRGVLGESIRAEFDADPGLPPVLIDPTQFEDAMMNLALNARDAMPNGGTFTVKAQVLTMAGVDQSLPVGKYVELNVVDTGAGMTREVIEQAFEPFFTTKESGTGLGLSMVYGFAKRSGGHVELTSAPGEGTTVRLVLPAAKTAALPVQTRNLAPSPLAGNERILLVEDRDDVREAVGTALQSLGYRVSTAASGAEALALLETGEPVDLLLTDIVMPGGISGLNLLSLALQLKPGIKAVLVTGFADKDLGGSTAQFPDVPLLRKPYRLAELAVLLRRVLGDVGSLGDQAGEAPSSTSTAS